MNQYPKWLLILLAPSLLVPIFTMVFYLFGVSYLIPSSIVQTPVAWLVIVLFQLFWIAPLLCFFLSLFLWGWMREQAAKITAFIGLSISLASLVVLLL